VTCAQAASQSIVLSAESDSPLAKSDNGSISIDYSEGGSIFPPEITLPTFMARSRKFRQNLERPDCLCRRLKLHPFSLSGRADEDWGDRQALYFQHQPTSIPHAGTSRRTYLEAGGADLGFRQEAPGGALSRVF